MLAEFRQNWTRLKGSELGRKTSKVNNNTSRRAVAPITKTHVPLPYLWTAVLEELQELGDHNVQRPVQHVAVQDLGRVLADLLQGPERSLWGQNRNRKPNRNSEWFAFFLPLHCYNPCMRSLSMLQVTGGWSHRANQLGSRPEQTQ